MKKFILLLSTALFLTFGMNSCSKESTKRVASCTLDQTTWNLDSIITYPDSTLKTFSGNQRTYSCDSGFFTDGVQNTSFKYELNGTDYTVYIPVADTTVKFNFTLNIYNSTTSTDTMMIVSSKTNTQYLHKI